MSGSPSPPSEIFHVRARWRLQAKDDYRALPSKKLPGVTFVDPSGAFENVERLGEFVHRYRLQTPSIHGYARKKLVDEIIKPLNVGFQVHRQPVRDTRVEAFEISNCNACVLVVLRNWINPVFGSEITRVSTALNSLALKLATKYRRLWKYVVAPSFDKWQTTLDQFGDIHFFNLPYIIPESLVDRLARKTGVDYRAAFPHANDWDRHLTEQLRGILRDLLTLDSADGNPLTVENRARTHVGLEAEHSVCKNTLAPQAAQSEVPHIVTIQKEGLPYGEEGSN
jgi:hypothetical protein